MTHTLAGPPQTGERPPAQAQTVEAIDPATAEEYLARNDRNRQLRRNEIAKYARDMSAGNWVFTGDPIKFSPTGRLLDGQHRLRAIIESGCTVTMAVIRGVEDSAQAVMDSGTKRTAGDALRLDGITASNDTAALARMILTDGSRSPNVPSTAEVTCCVDADPTVHWIAASVVPSLSLSVTTNAVLGYAYWRTHHVDQEAAEEFFRSLAELTNLSAGSPILALHKRLASESANRRGGAGRAYRRETLSLIFGAWNAWRRGESRSIIKISRTQDGRLVVPEPL